MKVKRTLVIGSLLLVSGFFLSSCTKNPENDQTLETPMTDIDISSSEEVLTPPEPNNVSELFKGESNMPIDAQLETEVQEAHEAKVITNKGEFTIKLEPSEAPKTVENFAKKAQSKFYDGLTFHRVEDWVVQGGDPEGTGMGGGKMPTELNQLPFTEGSVGIARGGDINWSNDAQFFICTKDCSWLNGQYTNFGQVTAGMDVVKSMQIGDTIQTIEVK